MTKTFTLTLAGETREVEASDVWGDGKRFDSTTACGAYRKREGARIWADVIRFWRQPDGSYKAATSTTILNRAGYSLIGWAELVQRNASRHNSAVAQ